MSWFKESLSAIEAKELAELAEERDMIEHIVLFLEQKSAEEQRIHEDIAHITDEDTSELRKRLTGDIHEILGFLSRLRRKLGKHLRINELEQLYVQWESLLAAYQHTTWPAEMIQSESERLFVSMFTDMDGIRELLGRRHRQVIEFMGKTTQPQEIFHKGPPAPPPYILRG